MYYAHKLDPEKRLRSYLSIMHDDMDKLNASLPMIGKKEKRLLVTL